MASPAAYQRATFVGTHVNGAYTFFLVCFLSCWDKAFISSSEHSQSGFLLSGHTTALTTEISSISICSIPNTVFDNAFKPPAEPVYFCFLSPRSALGSLMYARDCTSSKCG